MLTQLFRVGTFCTLDTLGKLEEKKFSFIKVKSRIFCVVTQLQFPNLPVFSHMERLQVSLDFRVGSLEVGLKCTCKGLLEVDCLKFFRFGEIVRSQHTCSDTLHIPAELYIASRSKTF